MLVQPCVFSGMHAVEQVITIHHRTHMCLFHSLAEGGPKDFMKSSFVHIGTHAITIPLFIVGSKMFDSGNNALRLHTFYILLGNLTRQVRVLTEIFKVSSAQRRAVYIHTRT